MNGIKKLSSLIFVIIMIIVMLVGCGTDPASSSGSSSAPSSNAESKDADSSEAEPGGQRGYFQDKDHYTIKVMMFGTAATEAVEEISAELSKITEEKLNADVEMTMVGLGTYMDQLNMLLYSGEEFDLFCPLGNVQDMINSNQVQPIGDLLEAYAPNVTTIIDDKYWIGVSYEDQIYGVPINTEKASQLGFAMRKDICDELDIRYQEMSTLDEIHDALVSVKEAYPDMYPVVSDSGLMFAGAAFIGQNEVGDAYHLTIAEDPYVDEIKIVSFFESDLFIERVNMLYQWAQEGLIMPDASTNTEGSHALVAAGKAFGYFQHMKPGWETDQSINVGMELVSVRYGEPVASAGGVTWYVPTSSGDPERAVALLDLMYSDPDVSNLVVNGIEGKHYVVIDEENRVAAYPEGVTATSVNYTRMNWAWPNPQIAYLWEGQEYDIWEQYNEFNDSALVSTVYGFRFDTTNVMNEITACSNIYSKYVNALYAGSLNPEETLPILNKEMESAGINNIIVEKQQQVDEWLANK